MKPEKILVNQVANYLKVKYPNVIYRFDIAADLKLSIGQATRNKQLHPLRGYPDLFIAEPRNGLHGLFIELKATSIYKKDGTLLKSDHLQEQLHFLARLQKLGYGAVFSVGYESTVKIIDGYLM